MTPALAALLVLAMMDAVSIAPGRRAGLPINVEDEPARIVCEFTVMSAGPGVRAMLLGRNGKVLAATGFAQKGTLELNAPPGRYSVVLDNGMDNQHGAEVWVRAQVLTLESQPVELSRGRRAVVIAISALFLLAVAAYALSKIRAALPRRKGQPPPA